MSEDGIPCLWMRGGSSKGAYFLASDLPDEKAARDDLLLRIMGSPDPRQIDGIGGADPLTSKVAILSPPSRDDADVDYLFLQVFGPSMLPAILALALHNGAIIAHLLGREGETLVPTLRRDAPRGLTLWGWELAPRLSGPFIALCLYRWEIILRETAVMGLLGIATLGFYIDSAMAELRLDRAMVLLVATGLLTAAVDRVSRSLRRRTNLGEKRRMRDDCC